MHEFFTGCIGLFSDTLAAAGELEFFQFLYCFLVLEVSVVIFNIAAKSFRRM